MSITDKKNSLFGKKDPTAASSSVPSSTSLPKPPTIKPAAPVPKPGPPKISQEAKLKKIEEAKDLSEKATNYLTTTVFRWSPDYLAAAPLFDQAAELYKVAEQYDIARTMLQKSADSHEKYGSLSSAALCLIKAAKIASELQKKFKAASDHYQAAANLWAVNGNLDRCAETLTKAAKELEDSDCNEALNLYAAACQMLCPLETPKDSIKQCPSSTLDTYRAYFKCLIVNKGPDESLLPIANRMIEIFEAFEIESSMCKMMLTVTLLELYSGDVVRAENTYLNVHLNNKIYIKSKECEVADLYVLAFKRQDVTKLDEAQNHTQINYLDKEIQALARQLSLFRTKHGFVIPEEKAYNAVAKNISKDLDAAIQSVPPSHAVPEGEETSEFINSDVHNEDVDEFADENCFNGNDDEIDLS